jgi:hypothetical protein
MLGHKSATMTLDVYAGLFDNDLDGVADRMDGLSERVKNVSRAEVIDLRKAVD